MKVLFIGGTGNISTACALLAVKKGIDLHILTRGNKDAIPGTKTVIGDINSGMNLKDVLDKKYDVVVNFIAFTPEDIKRDYELFSDKTDQYIFISSASCYQTPLSHPIITESTPLHNPTWDYSHQKILCEELLMKLYKEKGFPVTIVRPSHTYESVIPIAIGGFHEWTTSQRILDEKEVIIHGNGKSLWAVTHSKDFAKGFVPLLGLPKSIGHAFHITSDEILTWNSIYESLASALGKSLKPIYIPTDFICYHEPTFYGSLATDKSECVIFDNSKIKSFVPEFSATIPFHHGIKEAVAWFLADKKRQFINWKKNVAIDKIIEKYKKALV